MIATVVVLGVIVFLALRASRRRGKARNTVSVLGQALNIPAPYRGKRWKVGDRWL